MTVKTKNNSSSALSEIKKLYEFMKTNELQTLDFEQEDTRVRLVRKSKEQVMPVLTSPVSGQVKPTETSAQQPVLGDTLKSPLMGIFYRSPSPSSPPFVKEGETVKQGQLLCLIEAMKVFNEVKADCDCVIEKVLVENGKPVKSRQPLFSIKKV